jgi:hypothetical protein
MVVLLASVAVLAAALIAAAPAAATFHEIKIRSIFRGPSASQAFVELQMYSAGQDQVGGHQFRVYNAAGTSFSGFTLPSDVGNGANQARILLGDTAAVGSPDFTISGLGTSLTNLASAGAACWEIYDCVSWGGFTGESHLPSPSGTPIAGGLSGSMVSVRSITANCPTALDPADDTNQSSADFGFATGYAPRNNSLAPPEVICPLPPATTTPTNTFNLQAAIKRCRKKFPKGPKRKKCIRKARQKAAAA